MSSPVASPARLTRTRARRGGGLLLLAGLLLMVVLASIAVGTKTIPLGTVIEVLRHPVDSFDSTVVHELRVPRTVLGLAAGIALGVSGALIQAITRNPLADPGILGVNAGAGFAVVIAVGVFGLTSLYAYVWFAFLGAVLATSVVYLLGNTGHGGGTPVRLTLAGIAFGAVLGGIGTAITLLDPATFDEMRFWNAGSLAGRPMTTFVEVLPFLAAGVLCALSQAHRLNAVALGETLARSLGTNVARTRLLSALAVTLLCGGATAAVGPIGFVGLMVPHVARWLIGPDQRWIMTYTCLIAPILLLSADVLGRVLIPPAELQVSIVTAFLGAPVLIALVRRGRASEL